MSDAANNSRGSVTESGWLARWRALPKDSIPRTVLVAALVSLVCSVLVAMAAVLLRPQQEQNRLLNKQQNILAVAGLLNKEQSIEEAFSAIEVRVLDLQSGEYVSDIDEAVFDQYEAVRDPAMSVAIDAGKDIANIRRRARYSSVYLVKSEGELRKIVLPVNGYGLWSTMYGFVAVERDGNTIAGLQFYQHAETPGLGAEINNPKWLNKWQGKMIFDDRGNPRIEVIRGNVRDDGDWTGASRTGEGPQYQVDGIAGATLTGNGVTNMMRYWFGPDGYGPYLRKIWELEERT